MKNWIWVLCLMMGVAGVATAEETPVDTATVAPVEVTEAAPVADEAPADEAMDEAVLDRLVFASGEVTAVQADQKSIEIRVYLDDEGNASDEVIKLTWSDATDITNGEDTLAAADIKTGQDVDVEYDPETKAMTYLFIY